MRGNPHAAFDVAGAGNVARSSWCDTRKRKGEPTGNTNIDLNRRVSPRPYYVTGLIGPGDRKSVQPMAERLAPGKYDQLHHFVTAGVWDSAPLETELLIQADKLVGAAMQ